MSTKRSTPALRQAVGELVAQLTDLAGDLQEETPEPVAPARLAKADVDPMLKAYKRAEKRVAAAKEALAAAKGQLLEAMAGADVLIVEETGQAVVEHREETSMILDAVRLRAEQAELVAGYQKPRTQRPFRVLV